MQDTEANHDLPPSKNDDGEAAEGASGDVGRRTFPIWALTLGAGVLAGLVSWAAGEAMREVIRPTRTEVRMRGSNRMIVSPHDRALADARNAAVSFAVLGGLLGAGLGAAGGLGRKDGRAAAAAGLLGLVLGAAASAGPAMLVLPAYNAYRARQPDEAIQSLLWPLLVHIGVWAPAGAAGGLAFAIGLASRGRAPAIILGGFLGAALGTVIYEFVGALAFPLAGTTRFVSETVGTRLFARIAVTVLAAAGVATGLTMKPSRGVAPPPAPAG